MQIRRIKRNDPLLDKVISLGDRNRKTLGHFPEGAFKDHARKRLILVAEEENKLHGYILYRIVQSKQRISITHLCIDDKFRGKGIAYQLLSKLCSIYKHRLRGISLSCREDYKKASKLWESFGFKAVRRKPGRGKKETYLNVWWYDFGNPDLFTVSETKNDKLKVVLDANILIKLREINDESDQEIRSLDADWINEECEFYYAPELYNEIKRDTDKERAERTRKFLRQNFTEIRCKPDFAKKIENELQDLLHGHSANDISDRKQLAECIESNSKYFVTTDEGILDKNEKIYQKYGVNVYRPIDLILRIDSIKNAVDYTSFRLEGANYDFSKVKHEQIGVIVDTFLKKDYSEKKSNFKSVLLSLAADTKYSEVKVVEDKKEGFIGIIGLRNKNNSLEIPLLRVVNTKVSEPLFHQLVMDIIKRSKVEEKNKILVLEPYFTELESSILYQYGFSHAEGIYKKVSLNGLYSLNDLLSMEIVNQSFNVNLLQRKFSKKSESINLKIEFEKKLWPVKISDFEIPTYIVPIKPVWAKDLFDYRLANETIFGSQASLIWSNENVYYRSVKPVSEKSPGRILWYLSKGKSRYSSRNKGIVATSYLDEVRIDLPKILFREFKHYGVYKWNSIYKLASEDLENELKALKFSFTEVFDDIIKLEEVNEILIKNGRPRNTFASPLEVSSKIFNEIYSKGIGNE